MIITPLGHTEFLVDIQNKQLENIRILIDSWLSEYVIGDLMERNTLIDLDPTQLSTIDAIYISHTHTDHLDPYTLVEIYQHASPLLILPVTLRYLGDLFTQFIPGIQIHYLSPKVPLHLRGIEITGYMFQQGDITNEDDVMMIAISNDDELLFAEIDTVPDEYDEEVQSELWKIFDRREYQTRLYLASRNELEGQLRIYDYDDRRQKSFRSEYIAGRKEEIRASYEKFEYEEYIDMPNIMTLPGFVRGFVGQGLRYPAILSESLSELSIFPLSEIASMETDIAKSFGYEFAQKALIPGRQYRIENSSIEQGRKECSIGTIRPNTISEKGSSTTRIFATGPLMDRELSETDISLAKVRIREVLNNRFLPYWSASPVASLRSALIKNPDGAYRIGFRVPVITRNEVIHISEKIEHGLLHPSQGQEQLQGQEQWIIFEYSFLGSQFVEVQNTPKLRIDEDYWMADVLDFLDGKQELYSNFWHILDSKRIYRLWTCLGANFCNDDLIIKKYRSHFERAIANQAPKEYIESIILGFEK